MEITGKVIKVLDMQEFTSKKPEKQGVVYKRFSFVLETVGQYPKKTVFTVMGEDKWKQMGIVVGGEYSVSFDIDAREWNGKWFNDLSAWRAVRVDNNGGQQQQAQAPAPQQTQSPVPEAPTGGQQQDDGSDLPF